MSGYRAWNAVGSAVGSDGDPARGPIQQLDAQARLQLLHQLRNAGLAHVQRFRRLGEAAGFHHADERLHRIESVHAGSRGCADCLDSTNSDGQRCPFIGPGPFFTVKPWLMTGRFRPIDGAY
ncbi:hypothetical protein G6F35_014176 [Rhizopus arrhizus]|nr:hypothetical protein G6F35_014176 [Rhizopus arrhizus]